MTEELGYLEKYSVAPAPSRDYYGIRILRDEVKLFLWKISHGPHRTPQVRATKFADFPNDKSLQEEIRRVFGKNALSFVSDLVAGRTKNSEDNSASARGWTRVFEEGRAMQRLARTSQPDRKRAVGARGRSAGVKVSAASKPRQRISSKTPLEVIKVAHPSPKKNIPASPSLPATSAEPSKASRRVIEVSEKITRMKVTRVTEESKMSRQVRSGDLTPGRASVDKSREKIRSALAPSKSTILNTDKSLITGSSVAGRRNVDLDQLIREEAKRQRERTSASDSYFTCLEGIESSAGDRRRSKDDSSSGNYEIENPRSSSSSVASAASPKGAARGPARSERSHLTDRYRSARDSSAMGRSDVGKKEPEKVPRETRNATEPVLAGSSAARRLDNLERLATLGRGSANRGSSRTSVAGQNAGASAKNRPPSMDEKKRSNSNKEIGEPRNK